jgi:putative tryptophan/tyrosine transport system substrate-binding protein
MTIDISRRKIIAALGGVAVVYPMLASAQQAERMRRIGVLISIAESDPEIPARVETFQRELRKLGWTEDGNVHIEYRFGAGDTNRISADAAELVAAKPDVIFASGTVAVSALQRATSTIPVVFVLVDDPLGTGLVSSLRHPAGNMTGFSNFEYTIGAKWLAALKEIAPQITRAVAILDRQNISSTGHFAAPDCRFFNGNTGRCGGDSRYRRDRKRH